MENSINRSGTSNDSIKGWEGIIKLDELDSLSYIKDIVYYFTGNHTTTEILIDILDKTVKYIDVQGMVLYQLNDSTKELTPLIVRGEKQNELSQLSKIKLKLGSGLIGYSVQMGKPELVNEVNKHQRFNPEYEIVVGFKIQTCLCYPVILRNKIFGGIELVNKRNKTGFTVTDLDFVSSVSGYIALLMENEHLSTTKAQIESMRESILENIPSGLILTDPQGTISYINRNAKRILGIQSDIMVGLHCHRAFPRQPELSKILMDTMVTKRTFNRQEVRVVNELNKPLLLGYGTILVTARDGKTVVGYGLTFQDITDLISVGKTIG